MGIAIAIGFVFLIFHFPNLVKMVTPGQNLTGGAKPAQNPQVVGSGVPRRIGCSSSDPMTNARADDEPPI